MSVERIRESLASGGFELAAPLAIDQYDALVPEAWAARRLHPPARGVLIVANAGRGLWPRFLASPESSAAEDPLDAYTRRVVRESTQPDAGFALYNEQREGQYLPLVALGREAGLGTPGRVGVLLHPRYGPWLSLRAVVFANEPVPASEPLSFDPCSGCPAPCAAVCHGRVIGERGVDVEACYQTRLHNPECALRCDARAACVVGPEHAFPPEQIAHHSRIRR